MKKLLAIMSFLTLSFISACSSNYEYKTIKIYAPTLTRTGEEAFKPNSIDYIIVDSTLNANGKEGWELVSCYIETETAYPNFGSSQYVTGLQTNVRTQDLVCIMKKKK